MICMPVKGMVRAAVLAVIKLQTCTTDGAGSEFPQTLRGQNLCLHGQKQLIMMRIAGHPGLCQVSSDRKKSLLIMLYWAEFLSVLQKTVNR